MGHDVRQVVLDTETTGLEPAAGHRIIEIGCVELVNRRATSRYFHCYVNPERPVEGEAFAIHGNDDAFLETQPRFAEVAEEFLDFVRGAELVIHNASFDVEFIDRELAHLGGVPEQIGDCCEILDTLAMARHMHPGQANNLDALAARYGVERRGGALHGALLDAQVLAEVYLAMTGGQVSLSFEEHAAPIAQYALDGLRIERHDLVLPVLKASAEELAAHEAMLARIRQEAGRSTAPAEVPEGSRVSRTLRAVQKKNAEIV